MRKNNSQNSYRQELRERILATAMNEFYTKGIKPVKMDDTPLHIKTHAVRDLSE